MESISKMYDTRQKRKSDGSKSRVDWKRTKVDSISHILDSDESTTSEEEDEETSEEEVNERNSGYSSPTVDSEKHQAESLTPAENDADDCINQPRRKSTSARINSSDSSSDFEGPVRKVNVKRCRIIVDDDEGHEGKGDHLLNKDKDVEGTSEDEENEAHIKKQKRLENLKQLAERRKSRCRTSSRESLELNPSDMNSPLTPEEELSESEEREHMSDFIEEDEGETRDEAVGNQSVQELFMKHNISQFAGRNLYSHLEKVINAFIINIADDNFLESLYKGIRTKRYAKDMLTSLNYLEGRIIGPRLQKLTTSCRWRNQYKERLCCYPHLLIKEIGTVKKSCDACGLQRHCRFLVTLSGQEYDKKTLKSDDFLPNDKQVLFVGNVCASRTEVYHSLQHYQYFLYQHCIPFLEPIQDVPAKELVNIALSKIKEDNFIEKELYLLEQYLSDADYFQEEILI